MVSAGVTVFEVPLDGAPVLAGCRLLSIDERARADRFRFRRDRDRFIASRIALRMILADATKTGPHELQLSSGPHGKPVLSGNSSVHFNVSRSGGTALVAVTREADVGVDIERLDAKIEASTMARHFFSVSERAELATLSAIDRARGFFNAWTRKEAYLKARGDGIAHGLDHFDVTLAPETSAALTNDRRDPPAPNHWCLTNLDAPEGFVAALATRGQTLAVRRCQFDWTTASRQIDAS